MFIQFFEHSDVNVTKGPAMRGVQSEGAFFSRIEGIFGSKMYHTPVNLTFGPVDAKNIWEYRG